MLDRPYSSQLTVKAKPWWFFTILSMIALVCISCNDTPQQTSSSGGGTMQSPHVTEWGKMPLTDSAPQQGDVTPTVLPIAHSPVSTGSALTLYDNGVSPLFIDNKL